MAMVIPREVVEFYHIDTSTVFVLKIDTRRNIVVHIIENIEKFQDKMIPADESFLASKQQASLEAQ